MLWSFFLSLVGGMDGEVRLFHISGKRLLQTFVHSTPVKVEGGQQKDAEGPGEGTGAEGMEEGSDDDDEEEGEEQLEEVKAVECVGLAAKDLKYVSHCSCPDSMHSFLVALLCCVLYRWLASGGADFTMKIWDINTGTCRCVCRHEDSVVALQWHQSLPVVATGCLDFNVRLWDARSGNVLHDGVYLVEFSFP